MFQIVTFLSQILTIYGFVFLLAHDFGIFSIWDLFEAILLQ